MEVADIEADKPRQLGRPSSPGRCPVINLDDEPQLDAAVAGADLTVSLAPFPYHPKIATHCLEHKKHLRHGLLRQPGHGRDGRRGQEFRPDFPERRSASSPGIDHMESMRIIHDIRGRGGRVQEFISFCGGLPAPEADTNPWRPSFS